MADYASLIRPTGLIGRYAAVILDHNSYFQDSAEKGGDMVHQTISLRRGNKISRNDARSLVLTMARFGNHYNLPIDSTASDATIKTFFENNGIDFDQVVDSARVYPSEIPIVENQWPSTMIASDGLRIASLHSDGRVETLLEGGGQVTPEPYLGAFEGAIERLAAAAERLSPEDLLTASQRAIASIEGFIAARAHDWNGWHKNDRLIDDAENKVPFDKKIDEWLPRITGRRLNKGGRNWQDFGKLKSFRDKRATHQSGAGHGLSWKEFADISNLFKRGMAGVLLDLHKLFEVKIPSSIIHEAFAPDFILDRGANAKF